MYRMTADYPVKAFDMFEHTFKTGLLRPQAVAVSLLAIHVLLSPLNADSPDIRSWIVDLDSQAFETREAATNSLIDAGKPALQPIALHFYKATPEAAWRIKRVLQQIGTGSKEEVTSLKAIGLLLVLDSQLDTELEGMIEAWREHRSDRAINYLVQKGARTSPTDLQTQLFIPRGGTITPNRFQIESSKNPLRSKPGSGKLKLSEARSEIAKLVNADLEQVQEFVFSNMPKTSKTNSNQQLMDDIFIARAAIRGIGNNGRTSTYLEFGDDWKGNRDDLERLREIHTLNAVRFVNVKLNDDISDLFSELQSLQHVGFSNAQVRGGHLFDLNLPPNVLSVELREQNIESKTIDWLAKRSLTSLTFDDCKFPKGLQDRIDKFDDLELLSLKRLNLSGEAFDKLQRMVKVQRILLSVCKFDPDDCRKFNLVRPRVISFNPVSFLGVQAKQNVRQGDFSCQIETVVVGSAAERAGLLSGDVIEQVNGEPIATFDELRMFISQMEIGEEMRMQVGRRDEKLQLTAKLGTNENR